MAEKKKEEQAETAPIAPKIEMHRGAPIQVALYDLNRINAQQKEIKAKRLNDIEEIRRSEEVEKARNPTSTSYLCARFEKEYRVVIENMAREEYEWEET